MYLACMTGRQAVTWLLRTAAVAHDEAQAVDIGNALMHRGLLHHVVSYSCPVFNPTILATSACRCCD